MKIKNCFSIFALPAYVATSLFVFHLILIQPSFSKDKSRIKYDYVTDNPDQSEKKVSEDSDESEEKSEKLNSEKLFKQVRSLVKEYYPKAKIKEKDNNLKVEYKTRPYVISSTNKIEKGPKWDGILFEMKLVKGKYKGVHSVPKKFNQYSYFHVVLMAPYSEDKNCHLWTRISYPFNVPPDFLKRFTLVTNKFEEYM